MGAAVEGIQHVYEAPGEIRFRLRGEDLSLTAFNGHTPGTLSVLFTDATSGKTTYAANRSLTVPAPGAGRHGLARLQPGGEPALRLHGSRHLPAAAGREPPAGGHRSRRTDPLRTTGRIMSTQPAQDRPLGHGLLLRGARRRRQPPGRVAGFPHSTGVRAGPGTPPRRGARRRVCRVPRGDVLRPRPAGSPGSAEPAWPGRCGPAQRPAARRVRRSRHALHRTDPGSGHRLHRAVPHLNPAGQPGLRVRRTGRLAGGRLTSAADAAAVGRETVPGERLSPGGRRFDRGRPQALGLAGRTTP